MSKKGASLIETMVAMVLLMIICFSSAYFFTIPPFRKEALRLASLERAAGMLDLMVFWQKYGYGGTNVLAVDFYEVIDYPNPSVVSAGTSSLNTLSFFKETTNKMANVAYTVQVKAFPLVEPSGASYNGVELKLYDSVHDTNSLFATLKMILPPK